MFFVRSMVCLPRLIAGSRSWALPLPDETAVGIARSFLLDDAERRRAELAAVLSQDAAFALWGVCRGGRWQSEPPTGIEALAAWFADHGLGALQWSEAEQESGELPDRDRLRRWSELAAEAVAVAHSAAALAGAERADRAYLFGLLHGAVRWLEASGSPIALAECAPGASCLPEWLVQLLHQIKDGTPVDGTARIISESLARVQAAGSDASHLRSRWTFSPSGAGRILPLLMSRLARLRQLETGFQAALEAEKLEALRSLAYGASHEINNPLNNISTRAQTLMREETDPERLHKLGVINKEAFRAYEMIADMMLFARPPALQAEPVDLAAVADQVIAELKSEAEEQGTTLTRAGPAEPVWIRADGGHLAVALRALCINSLEALGTGGRIEVLVRAIAGQADDSIKDGWAEILVRDTGPGIAPEVRRHLFDPYFSGREAGRGLGLGLSKCWTIVTEHGGRIDVTSEPGRGATFAIRLPKEACPNIRTAG